jgi:hypothetical protein
MADSLLNGVYAALLHSQVMNASEHLRKRIQYPASTQPFTAPSWDPRSSATGLDYHDLVRSPKNSADFRLCMGESYLQAVFPSFMGNFASLP